MKIIKPALALCLALAASLTLPSVATANTCTYAANVAAQRVYDNCMAYREDTMINRTTCQMQRTSSQSLSLSNCQSTRALHRKASNNECVSFQHEGVTVNC